MLEFLDCYPRFAPSPAIPPALEPITLGELKEQIRLLDDGAEDNLLESYIRSARELFESRTERALLKQTWQLYLDRFPTWAIDVRKCPLLDVPSIEYVDAFGELQTLPAGDYVVAKNSEPGRIMPARGKVWPSTDTRPEAVIITCVCGYGSDPTAVPENAKLAIRMLAGFWGNTGREAVGKVGDEIAYSFDCLVNRMRWTAYG